MKEIDRLLKQWIPVNTKVREELRNAIIKHKMDSMDKAYERGRKMEIQSCPHHKEDRITGNEF